MKKIKLFCFGFGQVAKYFVKKLINDKYSLSLVTTNTLKTKEFFFKNQKFKSYFFNNENYDKKLIKDLNNSNIILVSIPPVDGEDVVANFFEKEIKNFDFEWITYLSATSIYGDKKGNWVDEKSEPNPTSKNGKSRLAAEKKWIELFRKKDLPIQIFRLSGIYSPEHNIFNRIKSGSLKIVNKPNHFFSRIHVEDIANILTLSLDKFKSGEIYNVSDDYPCSNEKIAIYALDLLKIEKPKMIEIDQIDNKMIRGFYKDSKKVSNKKIKNVFSYKLKFSTYKEGLREIYNHLI